LPRNILVIEDDPDIARLVQLHLGDAGYTVSQCSNGSEGLKSIRRKTPDLLILDLMLPGLGGLELCRQLRAGPVYLPILMLTAKSTELDRVLGLEMGADDYVTKPFSMPELVARVNALFRRVDALQHDTGRSIPPLHFNGLEINPDKRMVRRNGDDLALTSKEFDLLLEFARNPGRAFSRAQLLDKVWGYGHAGYEHTVNSHINRLRAKIEQDPARPRYILTVWGIGYKFMDVPGSV